MSTIKVVIRPMIWPHGHARVDSAVDGDGRWLEGLVHGKVVAIASTPAAVRELAAEAVRLQELIDRGMKSVRVVVDARSRGTITVEKDVMTVGPGMDLQIVEKMQRAQQTAAPKMRGPSSRLFGLSMLTGRGKP